MMCWSGGAVPAAADVAVGQSSAPEPGGAAMKAILLQFKSDRDASIVALKAAEKLDPESDRGREIAGILKEIAQAMADKPDWKLTVTGS